MIIITLSDIMWIIIFGLILIGIFLYGIYLFFYDKFSKRFRKNCFDCKYYKLKDVAGSGGICYYKCTLRPDIERTHDMNDNIYYCKCDKYVDRRRIQDE